MEHAIMEPAITGNAIVEKTVREEFEQILTDMHDAGKSESDIVDIIETISSTPNIKDILTLLNHIIIKKRHVLAQKS